MDRKQRKNPATVATMAAIASPVITLALLLSLHAKLDRVADANATQPSEMASEVEIIPTLPDPEPVIPEADHEEEIAAIELETKEIELVGRTIWGEAMGVKSTAERAAVAWCILNRVDAWGQSIEEVVTKPHQFQGYRPKGECPQEHLDLAVDVLLRWKAEKAGAKNIGRVLPADYLYFIGDGERNHFSTEYPCANYWDWSLTDPYK